MNPYIEHFNNQEREFEESTAGHAEMSLYWLKTYKEVLRQNYLTHLKNEVARLEGEKKEQKGKDYGHPETDFITGYNSCLDKEIQLRKEAIKQLTKLI